jgi:NAD-dependent protein deacetylase/lipoamidase
MEQNDTLLLPEALLERLRKSSYLLVLTGAGMSAESGIATFRDAQTGLWAKYRPEDLATPQAFAANPARVWSWYEERREKVRDAEPHAGHFALVELESMVPRLSIVTQNVDSLHQRSGAGNVIELHGNIMRSICHLTSRPIDDEWLAKSNDCPPRSPWAQDGLARPDVVWFGESLSAGAMDAAMNAAIMCDFCFSIGTTSLVQPAASLPLLALENGASLVEINPQETPLSLHADFCLRGSASEAMTSIMHQLKNQVQDPEQ